MKNLIQFQSFAKQSKHVTIRNNKAVIYTRVSDIKQRDNTSLESQLKYCTEYANKNDMEICEYFGGTNESAKTDDRKEFQRMLSFVKTKKISHIIVYSTDRFSRAGESAIHTLAKIRRIGINLIAITQPADTQTSTGRFYQNLNLLFSKYDNDQRRDKTITGMRHRLLNGYWMGTAPIGYKNTRDEKNIPIIVPSEKAHLVRKAFEWKANENLSNAEIVNRLEKYGLKIYRQRLTNMFRNVVYCGLISHSLLDEQIIEGKHKAIVPRDLFLKVHGIQAMNNHKSKHNKTNENLPLKVFTKCATCKSPLTGYLVKKKNIYYYKCKTVGCPCNKNANDLHDKFNDILGKYQIDKKYIAPLKMQLKHTFEYFNTSNEDNTAHLKYNLKTINEKVEKIEERFVIGEIGGALYQKFSKKYDEQKKEIEQEIEKNSLDSSNLETYINNSIDLLCNLHNIWRLGSYTEKQKFQKLIFPDGITYDRKNDVVRTTRANSIFELTRSMSVSFRNKKNGQKNKNVILSAPVTAKGFEPPTLRAEI
ncbi:recombinase family protein [Kordia sp.]|uniref:recombinase family protein n=1 Tax=Kordia sp. TaxID=1965332 RepID=UPI003D27675C